MKKRAFTLAEVLITLGIIGVVSALTIPSLIQNYKSRVLETQFKKQYSALSQAIMRIYQDEYIDLIPANFGSSFSDKLKNYYHIMKDCGIVNIGTKGCIKLDPTENDVYNISLYKSYTGNNINFGYIDDGVLLLNDGTVLLFEQGSQASGMGAYLIGIDINGLGKGPNRFGHDVFVFRAGAKGDLSVEIPDLLNICSKTSMSSLNGYGCAEKALSNPDYFKNLPR